MAVVESLASVFQVHSWTDGIRIFFNGYLACPREQDATQDRRFQVIAGLTKTLDDNEDVICDRSTSFCAEKEKVTSVAHYAAVIHGEA